MNPTDWSQQATEFYKRWAEGQKQWFQGMGWPVDGAFAQAGAMGAAPARGTGAESWKESMEQWMRFLQGAQAAQGSDGWFRNLFNPAEWAKPVPGTFDFGIERVIEGPTFATLWDFDRKLLKLQQLAAQRTRDSAAYHNVMLAAWHQAAERFAKRMSTPGTNAPATFREWLDAWIETANETLVEVHRTPAFLEAQRNVTRSATDYRLAEREVAEAWCELQHVPTRSEMDETQQAVHELRREVRALQRRLDDSENPR